MSPPKKTNHPKASAKKEQKHGQAKPNHSQRNQGKHADAQPHSISIRNDAVVNRQSAAAPGEVKEQQMSTIPQGLTPNQLIAWAQTKPVASLPEPAPPSEAPPEGTPGETATVQWIVTEMDTDIALTTAPTTVVVGSIFLIDEEYMTVNNIAIVDNPGVTRATHGSAVATHEAGATVSIWPPA